MYVALNANAQIHTHTHTHARTLAHCLIWLYAHTSLIWCSRVCVCVCVCARVSCVYVSWVMKERKNVHIWTISLGELIQTHLIWLLFASCVRNSVLLFCYSLEYIIFNFFTHIFISYLLFINISSEWATKKGYISNEYSFEQTRTVKIDDAMRHNSRLLWIFFFWKKKRQQHHNKKKHTDKI